MKKIQIKIAQFPNPNKTFNLKYGFGAYVANNVIETYLDKKLNFIIKHNLSNLSDEQIDNKIISVFEHHVDNLIYNGNNIFEDITTLKVLDSIFHLKWESGKTFSSQINNTDIFIQCPIAKVLKWPVVEKMLIQCFQLIVQELVKEVFDARNFPNEFAPNSVILTNKKRKLETLGETTTQREISFSPISLLSHSKEEFMEIINHEVTHLVHFNHSILFYHANGQDWEEKYLFDEECQKDTEELMRQNNCKTFDELFALDKKAHPFLYPPVKLKQK